MLFIWGLLASKWPRFNAYCRYFRFLSLKFCIPFLFSFVLCVQCSYFLIIKRVVVRCGHSLWRISVSHDYVPLIMCHTYVIMTHSSWELIAKKLNTIKAIASNFRFELAILRLMKRGCRVTYVLFLRQIYCPLRFNFFIFLFHFYMSLWSVIYCLCYASLLI